MILKQLRYRFAPAIVRFAATSCLLLAPLNTIRASEEAAISVSGIEQKIQSAGAQATVRDLWRSDATWNALLQHVESGDRRWLMVANKLKGGTDAGQTETLRIAVSRAIQKNPADFLSVSWPVFGDDACHDLQIEPSAHQHQQFVNNTRQALSKIKASDLQSRRDSCLSALNQDH